MWIKRAGRPSAWIWAISKQLPRPWRSRAEEQQAILSFVERRRHLSAARTGELAQMMVGAIFGQQEDERSAERLILGLAKYYAGEQRREAA